MKSFLKIFFGLILLIIFVGVIVFVNQVFILEKAVSLRTGLSVHFSEIYFKKDNIEIQGTEVRNPSGYQQENALMIKNIQVVAPLVNYLDQKATIDKVSLDDITINFEKREPFSSQNNWNDLTARIDKSGSSPSESESKKEVLIKRLELKNIKIYIYTPGAEMQVQTIPHISFRDIKATDDDFIKKIVNAILIRILFQLKSQNLPIELPVDVYKGLFNTLENIF